MDFARLPITRMAMNKKMLWGVVCLVLCALSSAIGGYFAVLIQGHRIERQTLRVRKLELVDTKDDVRAVFSVDNDGSVFLRLLANNNVPVVELGVNETPGPFRRYTPSGSLTIRDGEGTPAIRLRTLGKGEASLSFSSTNNANVVGVGYGHYGDVIDGHDRGMWGIQIAGPNHESSGLNVFSRDGILQGFRAPLEPPNPVRQK